MDRATPTHLIETLSTRARNALCDGGFLTLGAVIDQSDRVLSSLPEFGSLSLKEVRSLRECISSLPRGQAAHGMTVQERVVFDRLVDAWNAFVALPVEHDDDNDEFRHGIHILQRQIMARPTRRALNAED